MFGHDDTLECFMVSNAKLSHDEIECSKELGRWVLCELHFGKCGIAPSHTLSWQAFTLACARASLATLVGKQPSELAGDITVDSIAPNHGKGRFDILDLRGTTREEILAREFRVAHSMLTANNLMCENFNWLQDVVEDIEMLHIDLTGFVIQ